MGVGDGNRFEGVDRDRPRRQQAALRRPPKEARYRLLKVIPMRRSPLRFTEDPRDWAGLRPDESDLPSWRSLRRARHQALGTVIYARIGFRLPEARAPRSWSDVTPVAVRASLRDPWVTDWSALDTISRWRQVGIDADWPEFLAPAHEDLLAVMRLAHDRWRGTPGTFGAWLGRRFLPGGPLVLRQIDQAWIRRVPYPIADTALRYEVALGEGPDAPVVGRTSDLSQARALARAQVEAARDVVAEILAAKGGLAAEVAACRARWPEPRIELMPYFYDAVSYPEPL